MKILIISDHKMKISLQKEDMEKYGLCPDEVDYDNEKSRKIFWKIINDAKMAGRFDVGDERVLLQMYPKTDGGGELFVTKLGKMSPSGIQKAEETQRVTTLQNERLIFRFSDLQFLKQAVRAASLLQDGEESDVYVDDDGTYYLTVLEQSNGKAKYRFLCEFGDTVPKSYYPFLKEHAKCLSERDGMEKITSL